MPVPAAWHHPLGPEPPWPDGDPEVGRGNAAGDRGGERMERILNLTQHPATPEQQDAGVVEPADKARVRQLLTFEEIPSKDELAKRAAALAEIAAGEGAETAMIGGAPFFMSSLEAALKKMGIRPVYAFSRREVVEQTTENGEVRKVAVFRHLGFVEV